MIISSFTEGKHLSEYQDLAEHEDLRIKSLFFHQPSMASTYDSAESIATPPRDSDLDNDQIRALLASATASIGARGKCGTIARLSLW